MGEFGLHLELVRSRWRLCNSAHVALVETLQAHPNGGICQEKGTGPLASIKSTSYDSPQDITVTTSRNLSPCA